VKKLFIAILAVLYFGVSSGMVVNIHYCMGKVSSVTLSSEEKACKCSKLAKKKMPCCKSESKLVKMQDDQQTSLISHLVAPVLAEIILLYSTISIPSPVSFDVIETVYDHGPPLVNSSPLYLQYNVFRI
jgi:hypothetical protein